MRHSSRGSTSTPVHNAHTLAIGGVTIRLRSTHPVIAPPTPFDAKRRGASVGPGTKPLAVDLRILTVSPPDLSDSSPLFEPGEGWYARRKGRHRHLLMHPPGFPEPVWCARTDASHRHYDVFCGKAMQRRMGHGIAVLSPLTYPLDMIVVMMALARSGTGGLIHAAGIKRNDDVIILPGRSGAGKTTLSRLCGRDPGITLLSDDRLALRRSRSGFVAFGTPWSGTGKASANACGRLAAIVFPARGRCERLAPLTPAAAAERLLNVLSIPWFDATATRNMLALCDRLARQIPAYVLEFRRNGNVSEIVNTLFDRMNGTR